MLAGHFNVQLLALTVTVNEHVARSPETLLTSQVTVVAPSGKLEPEGGLQAEVSIAQLSFEVGDLYWTMAKPMRSVFSSTVMSAGQARVSRCGSSTVTVKLHDVPVLPTQRTGVVPTGNNEPDAGLQTRVPQLLPVAAGTA